MARMSYIPTTRRRENKLQSSRVRGGRARQRHAVTPRRPSPGRSARLTASPKELVTRPESGVPQGTLISKAVGRAGSVEHRSGDDSRKGKREERSPGTLEQAGQRNGLRGISSSEPPPGVSADWAATRDAVVGMFAMAWRGR